MTRSIKIGIIILIVVLLSVAVVTTSLTYAIWYGGGGGEGESTTFGPVMQSTEWNVYAKYFNTVSVEGGVAVTGFSGINLQDVIIPEKIGDNNVVEIRNIFTENTQKSLVVTIKIPATIRKISNSAFMNLPNLQKVTFASYRYGVDPTSKYTCMCGQYLFSGCTSLANIYICGDKNVNFDDYSFIGCTKLTTAPTPQDVYVLVDDTNGKTTNEMKEIKGNANNIHYTSNAQTGASFSLQPLNSLS